MVANERDVMFENSQEHTLFNFHFSKIRQDGQDREKHF